VKRIALILAPAVATLIAIGGHAQPLKDEDVAVIVRLAAIEASVGMPLPLVERLCIDEQLGRRSIDDSNGPGALRDQDRLRYAFERCRIAHASPAAGADVHAASSPGKSDYRLLPQIRERFTAQLAQLSGAEERLTQCRTSATAELLESCVRSVLQRDLSDCEMDPFRRKWETAQAEQNAMRESPAFERTAETR
jgi:hypothetical protein